MSSSAELEQAWAAIEKPLRGSLAGRRLRDGVGRWAAIDADGAPYFLIEVAPAAADTELPSIRGLDAVIDNLRIGDEKPRHYIALSCPRPDYRGTFAALCGELSLHGSPGDPVGLVTGTLKRWQGFFQNRRGRLSREQCLGLFAELWFLEHWIGIPDGIDWWRGPMGAHHDFQSRGFSIEVKATSVTKGPVTHRISSLQQLEAPAEGRLFLYSLQVLPDDLAANSLSSSAARIIGLLDADENALGTFLSALAQAGYDPGDARLYEETWRVIDEGLFEVQPGFPRLTTCDSEQWGDGISDVTYSITLDACAAWRVASSPTEFSFGGSR